MTNDQAEFLLTQVYLPQIQNEHKTTSRVIAAVPADKCDFKPHANSMGALQLAWHIAASECFFMNGVVAGKFRTGGSIAGSVNTTAGRFAWVIAKFSQATTAIVGVKNRAFSALI